MAFVVSVKADIRDVMRMLNDIEKKVVPKATKRALKRTASAVRTQAARAIAEETGFKVGLVKRHVVITVKPTNSSLRTVIKAKKNPVNLIEFVSKANRNPGAFRKRKRAGAFKYSGVRARAWKQLKTYKGTFIVKGRGSGKMVVVSRVGQARYPLKNISGPSIPKTFLRRHIIGRLKINARKIFRKNLEADLKFFLRKIK